jgi:hypothetical protein
MRLWSLHPRYLDRAGLAALWREALLAQAVLRGETRGYRFHPQLLRFRGHPNPEEAIGAYLEKVWQEASERGYRYDPSKISLHSSKHPIPLTRGQLLYEKEHLLKKLLVRDPSRFSVLAEIVTPLPHPLFAVVEGEVEPWEKIAKSGRRAVSPAA